MEFKQYYVVLLKKGPNWTAKSTPELDDLQQQHLAHLRSLAQNEMLLLAGPVQTHDETNLRGISIFSTDQFDSLEACIAVVEDDPMFQIGHLAADYVTWYTSATVIVHHGMQNDA